MVNKWKEILILNWFEYSKEHQWLRDDWLQIKKEKRQYILCYWDWEVQYFVNFNELLWCMIVKSMIYRLF